MQNKPNLLNAQTNVTSVTTSQYQENRPSSPPKTNPIQTQFKASQTQLAQMPKMNVSLYLTNHYKNQQLPRRQQNKPNQTQYTIYNPPAFFSSAYCPLPFRHHSPANPGGIQSAAAGNRPGRIEPRVIKRRPKSYSLMTKPREQYKQAKT